MKNFSTIYQELYKESHDELEILRKEARKKTLILFAVLLAMCAMIFTISTITAIFTLIIPLYAVLFSPFYKEYKKQYKNVIIKKLVTFYDPNLSFNPNSRIKSSSYSDAEFEKYDYFFANDLVLGKIDNEIEFEAGDVRTEIENSKEDTRSSRTVVFRGLFSAAKFNTDIQNTIKIRSDKGLLGKLLPTDKQLVQLDSLEFEKIFDVYSTDKLLAVRILTSDILDFMINFKKENKLKYELTLKNSSLYIRIYCKDLFEAPFRKDSLDFDSLYMDYKILHFLCELNRKFFHTIKEKDI